FPLLLGYGQAPVAQVPNGPEAGQKTGAAPADLSPGVAEVVRLAESGVGDDVVLAFVQNSKSTFALSADHVLYLKDLGLSAPVITAMLNHDSALRNQPQSYAYDQKLYPPTGQPPVAPLPIAAPPPAEPPPPEPSVPPGAATAPPPTYVSNPPPAVNYFYNDLSPYGTWVVLD